MDLLPESDNEHIEEIAEPGQPQIELKRGPGRPKKIYTEQKGRPKLVYNYVPNLNQPNNDEDVADSATENLDFSLDNDELFYNACQLIQANVSEVNQKIALESNDSNEWQNAIYTEMKSLINNDTWKIVKRPVDKNVVGCRMVLTNKINPDGTLARRKARLVARGYSQKSGSDFKETFAPRKAELYEINHGTSCKI